MPSSPAVFTSAALAAMVVAQTPVFVEPLDCISRFGYDTATPPTPVVAGSSRTLPVNSVNDFVATHLCQPLSYRDFLKALSCSFCLLVPILILLECRASSWRMNMQHRFGDAWTALPRQQFQTDLQHAMQHRFMQEIPAPDFGELAEHLYSCRSHSPGMDGNISFNYVIAFIRWTPRCIRPPHSFMCMP